MKNQMEDVKSLIPTTHRLAMWDISLEDQTRIRIAAMVPKKIEGEAKVESVPFAVAWCSSADAKDYSHRKARAIACGRLEKFLLKITKPEQAELSKITKVFHATQAEGLEKTSRQEAEINMIDMFRDLENKYGKFVWNCGIIPELEKYDHDTVLETVLCSVGGVPGAPRAKILSLVDKLKQFEKVTATLEAAQDGI